MCVKSKSTRGVNMSKETLFINATVSALLCVHHGEEKPFLLGVLKIIFFFIVVDKKKT